MLKKKKRDDYTYIENIVIFMKKINTCERARTGSEELSWGELERKRCCLEKGEEEL